MAFLQKLFGTQDQMHDAQLQGTAARTEDDEDSNKAHEAWKQKFREPQIRLVRSDPEPFKPERRLGGGGVGIVYETYLDGIALALKRTYTQKLGERDLNEIKILGQLSGRRHKHIVQLIGSYIHRQRNGYEIGLLMSPVAHCDLACFMHKMDLLASWMQLPRESSDINLEDEIQCAVEVLSVFWIDSPNAGSLLSSEQESKSLYKALQQRLCQSFLCVSSAVEYLHRNRIRHKDLKPSQILLSPNGLWLTDFGYSNDMSEYTDSATSNWDTMTYRYQAPERAAKGSCSRREDIFALGCTFLEMGIHLTDSAAETIGSWKSSAGNKWSFQEHLVDTDSWVAPIRAADDSRVQCLGNLICQMIEKNSSCRPTIDKVIELLSQESFGEENPWCPLGSFFRPCCAPKKVLSAHRKFFLTVSKKLYD
jgi:serine/threonine protein kinase